MTRILTDGDVRRIIGAARAEVFGALIDHIAAGYAEQAKGVMRDHSRIYLRYPDQGERRPPGLFSMSALLPELGIMGTRLLALGGGTHAEGLLVLFEYRSNRCLAIINDDTIHPYRSAGPCGLATRLLARRDSRVVGCIGSGSMARGGLTMVLHELPNAELVKIYSPTAEHRTRFAAEMREWLDVEVTAVDSPEQAADADVLVTGTDADRPVVADSAIRPGTHINLMARNEIELTTFRRSTIVSSSHRMLRELDPPLHEPIPDEWIHCEIADLVAGTAQGRTSPEQITTFIGVAPLAMWDVTSAAVFYEAAVRLGIGTEVNFTS